MISLDPPGVESVPADIGNQKRAAQEADRRARNYHSCQADDGSNKEAATYMAPKKFSYTNAPCK